MKRFQRNYSTLIVGFIIINCMTFINFYQATTIPFVLLFLPLIMLAGYLEDTIGALWATGAAALATVVMIVFEMITPINSMVTVIGLGLTFGLIVLINYDREKKNKERQLEIEPQEMELAAIKHKAFITREQIERYEKRLKGLVKLYEMSKVLGTILELPVMLDEARMIIAQIMKHHFSRVNQEATRLAVYIPDEESSGFLRVGSRGLDVSDEGFPENISVHELKLWLGEDFNSVRVKDLRQEERYHSLSRMVTFRSFIAIPLVIKDIVIGVMMLGANQPEVFSANDFNTLEVLSKQIVLALRRSLLYRQVQKLSFTDSQTGLYVHRFFQERLYEEIIRANRYYQQLSLLMMDLDHFKQINDTYGHQVGDMILIEVAKRIKQAADKTALVARYGGEEFSVILPNCSLEEAVTTARKINHEVKKTPMNADGQQLTVTISIGISALSRAARNQENLLRHADNALYQAKRAGRDCVMKFMDED